MRPQTLALLFVMSAGGLGVLPAATPCRAGQIPFTLGSTVTSINGTLGYNAGTGEFMTTSSAVSLNSTLLSSGFSIFTVPGTVSIDLFVDKNGNFLNNGTGVVITGTVSVNGTPVTGTAMNPLLTGTITAFGADAAGPPTWGFDGLFTMTGGQLTSPVPMPGGGATPAIFTAGSAGGFLMSAENVTTGILGNFTQSFSSSSVKGSTGAIIPEPSSLLLALIGSGFVVGWKVFHPARRRGLGLGR